MNHELSALRHIAKGDYISAMRDYDAAIDEANHPAVIQVLKAERIRCAEKAFPSRWQKFWKQLGMTA